MPPSQRVDGKRQVERLKLQPIHLAVLLDDTAALRTLVSSNVDLNARDGFGVTALMQAALFSNVKMFKALLTYGASVGETDKMGRTARAYAKTKPFPPSRSHNQYRKAGARLPPLNKKLLKGRRQIRALLKTPGAAHSLAMSQTHPLSALKFEIQGKNLAVVMPLARVKTRRLLEFSTVGLIAGAEQNCLTMCATSGWTPNSTGGERHLLDEAEWTQNVRDFCDIVGFHLWRNRNDSSKLQRQEEDGGRWSACHVEKKLSLYWLRRQLKMTFGTDDYANMARLKTAELPLSRRRAYLYLNHYPCRNCWDFAALIKELSGLEVILQPRPFLVRGKRPDRPVQPPAPDQQPVSVGAQQARDSDAEAGVDTPTRGTTSKDDTTPSDSPGRDQIPADNGHIHEQIGLCKPPAKPRVDSTGGTQLDREVPEARSTWRDVVTESPTFSHMDVEYTPPRHRISPYEPTPKQTGRKRCTPPWANGKPPITPVTCDPFVTNYSLPAATAAPTAENATGLKSPVPLPSLMDGDTAQRTPQLAGEAAAATLAATESTSWETSRSEFGFGADDSCTRTGIRGEQESHFFETGSGHDQGGASLTSLPLEDDTGGLRLDIEIVNVDESPRPEGEGQGDDGFGLQDALSATHELSTSSSSRHDPLTTASDFIDLTTPEPESIGLGASRRVDTSGAIGVSIDRNNNDSGMAAPSVNSLSGLRLDTARIREERARVRARIQSFASAAQTVGSRGRRVNNRGGRGGGKAAAAATTTWQQRRHVRNHLGAGMAGLGRFTRGKRLG